MKKLICLMGFMTISLANASDNDNASCTNTYKGVGLTAVYFRTVTPVDSLDGTVGQVECDYVTGTGSGIQVYTYSPNNYGPATLNQPDNFKNMKWENNWVCPTNDPKNCTFNF